MIRGQKSLKYASAFINSLKATGAALSESQISAVIELANGLNQIGWDKFHAVYPFIGGTADSHSFNLINPGKHKITWQGTVTHNANGIQGDGSTGYGNLNVSPSQIFSLYSASMFLYNRTDELQAAVDFGVSDGYPGAPASEIFCGYDDGAGGYAGGDHPVDSAPRAFIYSPGVIRTTSFSRISETSLRIYNKGVVGESATPPGDLTMSSNNMFICCRNNNGGPAYFSSRNIALAGMGVGLTDDEHWLLHQIIQRFQTTLGRAV